MGAPRRETYINPVMCISISIISDYLLDKHPNMGNLIIIVTVGYIDGMPIES